MSDLLNIKYINSLPQPLTATFYGNGGVWPVIDIEVESGLMQIDVCGKLQVCDISDMDYFTDDNGVNYDSDTFYNE